MCAIIGRPNQSTRVLHINITSLYPKDIFMRRQSVCHHVKADPSPLRRASVYIIVLYWTMPELKSDRFLFLAPQNVDCNVLPRKKMILASVSFFFFWTDMQIYTFIHKNCHSSWHECNFVEIILAKFDKFIYCDDWCVSFHALLISTTMHVCQF